MGSLFNVDAATGHFTTDIVTSGSITSTSTTSGFLLPKMTTTQRDAISFPATGLQIFNTTTNEIEFYNGTVWSAVGGGGTINPGTTNQVAYYAASGSAISGSPILSTVDSGNAELLLTSNLGSGATIFQMSGSGTSSSHIEMILSTGAYDLNNTSGLFNLTDSTHNINAWTYNPNVTNSNITNAITTINTSLALNSFSQALTGDIQMSPLPAVTNITGHFNGVGGTATYTYKVIAKTFDGKAGPDSATAGFATAPNTLGGGNSILIKWGTGATAFGADGAHTIGATSYDIYRVAVSGGSPSSLGKIGSTTTTTFTDTGLAGDGTSTPGATSGTITNVTDPLNAQDVATKNYVDTHSTNIQIQSSTSSPSTHATDILTRTITTTGGKVLALGSFALSGVTDGVGRFGFSGNITRDTTAITGGVTSGTFFTQASQTQGIPLNVVAIDSPPAGTYTYRLSYSSAFATGVSASGYSLIVIEL